MTEKDTLDKELLWIERTKLATSLEKNFKSAVDILDFVNEYLLKSKPEKFEKKQLRDDLNFLILQTTKVYILLCDKTEEVFNDAVCFHAFNYYGREWIDSPIPTLSEEVAAISLSLEKLNGFIVSMLYYFGSKRIEFERQQYILFLELCKKIILEAYFLRGGLFNNVLIH